MYLNPLDSNNLKSISHRNKVSCLQLVNPVGRESILVNIIHKNLEEAKTTIIIVPSAKEENDIKTYLSNHKLESLALSIQDNKPINEKELSYFRGALKNVNEINDNQEYQLLRTNAERSLTELNECYAYLDEKVFGDRSWRTLASQKEHFTYDGEVALLKRKYKGASLNFTQKEYWYIRGRLEAASESYLKHFDVLDNANELSGDVQLEDEEIIRVLKLINRFVTEGEEILRKSGEFISTLSHAQSSAGLEELEQLNAMIAALNQSLIEYEKRYLNNSVDESLGGKLKKAFSKNISAKSDAESALVQQVNFLLSEVNQSAYFSPPQIEFDSTTFDAAKFKSIVVDLQGMAKDWNSSFELHKSNKLKQIGPLNSNDPILLDLAKSLEAYISKINKANILKLPLQDNAFSFINKLDYLDVILSKLFQTKWIIEGNDKYIQWLRLLSLCTDETVLIIEAIKHFNPRDWTRIFDQYYIQEILHRNFNPKMPKNGVQIENISDTISRYRLLSIDAIKQIWNNLKYEQIHNLKKSNKALYTDLIKKNTPVDTTWSKLITSQPDFVASVFPIMIVHENVLNKVKPLYYKWSDCIIYNWSKFREILSFQLKALSSNQLVIEDNTLTDHVENHIRSYYEPNQVNLALLTGDYLGNVKFEIKDLDNAEKIRVTKSLAKMLVDIQPNINLYYLKSHHLISTLSSKANSELKQSLHQQGIKEINPKDDLVGAVMDILVNTSKQTIILMEDGLLNTSAIDSFDWQHTTMSRLKTLGIKLINNWTSDAYGRNSIDFSSELELETQLSDFAPEEEDLSPTLFDN